MCVGCILLDQSMNRIEDENLGFHKTIFYFPISSQPFDLSNVKFLYFLAASLKTNVSFYISILGLYVLNTQRKDKNGKLWTLFSLVFVHNLHNT